MKIGKKLIAGLNVEGKAVLVAKGGAAGGGNRLYPVITQIEYGKPGEVVDVHLELESRRYWLFRVSEPWEIDFIGLFNKSVSEI